MRHTAAAPAVDVLAGGEPVFTDLTNPNEASADLPAGTVSASVALAGTTDPVIGPADVPVTEGSATIVYAVGSAEDGNLNVLVQTIGGLHSAPAGVDTGNSGLAADDTGSFPVAAVVLGVLALGLGGAPLAARRASRTAELMPHRRLRRPAAPVRTWTRAAGLAALLLTFAACGGGEAAPDGTSRAQRKPLHHDDHHRHHDDDHRSIRTVGGDRAGSARTGARRWRSRSGCASGRSASTPSSEPSGSSPTATWRCRRPPRSVGTGSVPPLEPRARPCSPRTSTTTARRGAFFRLRELSVGAEARVDLDDGSA